MIVHHLQYNEKSIERKTDIVISLAMFKHLSNALSKERGMGQQMKNRVVLTFPVHMYNYNPYRLF